MQVIIQTTPKREKGNVSAIGNRWAWRFLCWKPGFLRGIDPAAAGITPKEKIITHKIHLSFSRDSRCFGSLSLFPKSAGSISVFPDAATVSPSSWQTSQQKGLVEPTGACLQIPLKSLQSAVENTTVKGIVLPKMKSQSLFTHCHADWRSG